MNKDDFIKVINGELFYKNDYCYWLYQQLEIRDKVIEKVYKLLLPYENDHEANYYTPIKQVIKVLRGVINEK